MSDEAPPPVPEPQKMQAHVPVVAKRPMPAPALIIVVLTIAVVITVVLILIGMQTVHAPETRMRCQSNLWSICTATAIYANDNDDMPPPNLHVLIKRGDLSQELLQCPANRNGGDTRIDYIYVPPPPDADPNAIIACDAEQFHKEGRNVLRQEYKVVWLPEDKFQQALAEQKNAHFAKEFRKAGGQ